MENGRLHADFQRNAITLARVGILVAVHDPLDQGERFVGWRGHAQIALVAAGVSVFGLLLAEARALLRLLAQRRDVDEMRIGVTGVSGGGQTSMFFPIVEPLVRAAVPVCYAGELATMIETFTGYNFYGGVDLCQQVPGLAEEATFSGVIGMAAPTPACYVNGIDDPNFPIEAAREAIAGGRRCYEESGAGEWLQLVEVPGGHGYGWAATQVACEFFQRVFGLASTPVQELSDNDLQAVPYAVDFTAAAQTEGPARQTFEAAWDEETRVLQGSLDSRPIVARLALRIAHETMQPPGTASPQCVRQVFGLDTVPLLGAPDITRSWARDGVVVERILIEPDQGVQLALTLFMPAAYDRAVPPVIVVSRQGSLRAFEAFNGGQLLVDGWAVCACEPRGYGETAGVEFELATTSLLLRRHLFAQRAWDIQAAITYLFERGVVGIQVDRSCLTLAAADAETGLLARVVAASDERVAALYTSEHYPSWGALLIQDPQVSPSLFVPRAAGRIRLEDLAPASGGPQTLGDAVDAGAYPEDAHPAALADWLRSVVRPLHSTSRYQG